MTSRCPNNIEFCTLSTPLSCHADHVRRALEFYQNYPCESDSDSFRYSKNLNVTAGTGALLDALVIPYYRNLFEQVSFQQECCDEQTILDGMDFNNSDPMLHEFFVQMESLFGWRRKAESIIFLTKEGDVLPGDIGVIIPLRDLNDFYNIVDAQNTGYVAAGMKGLRTGSCSLLDNIQITD